MSYLGYGLFLSSHKIGVKHCSHLVTMTGYRVADLIFSLDFTRYKISEEDERKITFCFMLIRMECKHYQHKYLIMSVNFLT